MILDADVQNTFQQLFRAHRETALAEDKVARLKGELEQAERDVIDCQRVVRDLNDKINAMARSAGGVAKPMQDDLARPRSEFIPFRR